MTAGGLVIVVRNNSFIDRAYVVTILKALEKIIIKDYRGLDMRLSYIYFDQSRRLMCDICLHI